MATPFDLEAVQTFVTASIGITLHEGPADSPRALLREADAAMYAAKESGRARYEVYDDTMRRRAVRRLEMTNDLRRALEREQLELVWHPIVTLGLTAGEQAPVSLEALLRWRHPDRGIVVPDDFIGLAEDTGLIRPIGEWALVAVAQQLAQWRREDPAGCPDLVSVNLSAHQLARPCIVDTVFSAFTDAGIEPTAVELEITETAFMGDPIHAIARLPRAPSSGLRHRHRRFRDRVLVDELPARSARLGAQGRPVVRRPSRTRPERSLDRGGHHRPGHAVGLQAVAEGVETTGQLRALEAMGCDRAQGFLWTRPLDPVDVPAWIERQRADQRQGSPVSSADPVRLCP